MRPIARASALLVAGCAMALAACTPTTAITGPPPRRPAADATNDLRGVLGPMLEHPSAEGRGDLEEPREGQDPSGLDRDRDPGELLWSQDATPEAPPPTISPPPPPEEKAERDERTKGGERARDDGNERKPAPRAATASALGGKLSADQVNAVIDANFDRLSACSDDEVVVSVRATVSTEGRVIEASAIRSTPDDPRIRDCIATTFRTLEFPRVASEWPTRLSFDLRIGGS